MKVIDAPRLAGFFPSRFVAIPAFLSIALLCLNSANAVNVYWDINGASTGATNTTTATGDWTNTDTNWTTNAAGTSATTTYATAAGGVPTIANPDVFFSAGTNATGTFTVSLKSDDEIARSITVQEGNVTIDSSSGNGSILTIGAGGVTVNSGATLAFTGVKLSLADGAPQTWVNNNSSATVNVNSGGTEPTGFAINSALTLNGGSFTFSTTNTTTNTGGITVSAGTLFANTAVTASTATGVVIVNGTGTLGGSGTITGPGTAASSAVTVSGGKINAGGTAGVIGTLNITNANPATTNALTLTGSSIFSADMTATTADLVNITGRVNLGTTSTLDLTIPNGTVFTAGQAFTLIANDAADAITGTFANAPVSGGGYFIDGYGFIVNYAGGTGNDLVLTAVPEPSTWVAAALTLLAIGFTQRRKVMARLNILPVSSSKL
jgi:hypothetical protein